MASNIWALTMPKWGLAMTEGKVVAWQAEEGSQVTPGQGIIEIETEKITNVCEAPAAGLLRKRIAGVGDTLPVGALLGVVADPSVSDDEINAFIANFKQEPIDEAGSGAQALLARTTIVQVDGKPIQYLKMGDAAATPIVLIHGLGGDLNNWLFNQSALSSRRTVYGVDLPGHGGSTKEVGAGDLQSMVAVVIGFLNALGLRRGHLVGQSLGGAIALSLALHHPERVATLTLVCPVGLGAEANISYFTSFVQAERRKELKAALEQLFANPAVISNQMINELLRYKRLEGVKSALGTMAAALFRDGRQAIVLRSRLGELKQPTQVIWGKDDRIVPASHAFNLPSSIRVHVLSGAGHMVHMEKATEVNKLIEDLAAAA